MKLRLDANSIRLRVALADASYLASGHTLEERLSFFDGELLLRVSAEDSLGFVARANRRQIDLHFSRSKLKKILNAAFKDRRPRKEECEIREFLEIGDRSVEIRFEVDLLSLNSQGETRYDTK